MVCVCGMEICESVRWKRWAQSESERQRQRESVCLDQLHSKSVYSAQFGIKHNRLLSACYCLWCPIKMEFIAALRASPNYTFFPLCSVLLSLSFALFFSGCGDGSASNSCTTCQTSQNGSLQTQTGRYCRHAHP